MWGPEKQRTLADLEGRFDWTPNRVIHQRTGLSLITMATHAGEASNISRRAICFPGGSRRRCRLAAVQHGIGMYALR